MIVSFLSFDQENHKIAFQSDVEYNNNQYCFVDKSMEETILTLSRQENGLFLERSGSCTMKMQFILNETTKGYYRNKEGLEFDFTIQTTNLIIEKNKIRLTYHMFLDGQEVTQQRIQLSFFERNT